MDYLIRTTIKEMEELGVLDAYYAKFNLDGSAPPPAYLTLTLAQAEKIGLIGSVDSKVAGELIAGPKPKKTRKTKAVK